jgi:hypothetical protein
VRQEQSPPPTPEARVGSVQDTPPLPPLCPSKPRRVIDRSAKIVRAELDLCKALSVSVVGDTAALLVDVLVAEFARRYELPTESLELHQLSIGDYLLLLPDEPTALRVYNEGRPIMLAPFMVLYRRWSRLKGASGTALPVLIDVSITSIPAHAWELETAEHLLDEWCWVSKLHPNTVNWHDDSSFKLTAWCFSHEPVPAAMDLVIVESPVFTEDGEHLKRALCYPISISVSSAPPTSCGRAPPPPEKDHDNRGGPSHNRR